MLEENSRTYTTVHAAQFHLMIDDDDGFFQNVIRHCGPAF